jgi:hypothetical protein
VRFTGDLDRPLVRPTLDNAARILEALEASGFPFAPPDAADSLVLQFCAAVDRHACTAVRPD